MDLGIHVPVSRLPPAPWHVLPGPLGKETRVLRLLICRFKHCLYTCTVISSTIKTHHVCNGRKQARDYYPARLTLVMTSACEGKYGNLGSIKRKRCLRQTSGLCEHLLHGFLCSVFIIPGMLGGSESLATLHVGR